MFGACEQSVAGCQSDVFSVDVYDGCRIRRELHTDGVVEHDVKLRRLALVDVGGCSLGLVAVLAQRHAV